MPNVFQDAVEQCRELAAVHETVAVYYSGGKDSLASLDLCAKHFRRVLAVHMWFVPGLEVMEARLDFARKRWGVEVYMTPHWMVSTFLKAGAYCFPQPHVAKVTLPDVIQYVRDDTGVNLAAYGGKKKDGFWRKRQMIATKRADVFYPLREWNKWDVLHYLAGQGIDAPEKFDLDLGQASLLWLHDEHLQDFRRVCEVYPYAEAVVKRREWFQVGGKAEAKARRGGAGNTDPDAGPATVPVREIHERGDSSGRAEERSVQPTDDHGAGPKEAEGQPGACGPD